MKRLLSLAAIGLAAAAGLAWLAGMFIYPPSNPPERYAGVILSPEADQVLRTACFDCHSNETRYPWYSRLPVVSLVIGRHVAEGRRELNYSTWGRMDARRRAKAIRETVESVREGEMPTLDYVLMNPDARMTAERVALLTQAAGPLALKGGKGKDDDDDDDHKKKRRKGKRDDD